MGNVKELGELLTQYNPKEISFWSENQEHYDIADPCKLKLSFSKAVVDEQLGLVHLSNEDSSLCLDRVVGVEYDESMMPVWIMVTVVCGDIASSSGEFRYRLIISS